MKTKVPTWFIVCFASNDGCVDLPMMRDPECEGALTSCCEGDVIALFQDRAAARKAITISAKYAALCREQGRPANDDFVPANRQYIHIRPCQL